MSTDLINSGIIRQVYENIYGKDDAHGDIPFYLPHMYRVYFKEGVLLKWK